MFDSVISQTRGVVTVGLSRGVLEGLVAGAGRVVAALNALQAQGSTEFIGFAVPRLAVLCSVIPCWQSVVMFDSMILQTRGVVTVGFWRGELEGLVAGAARVVAALNALQAQGSTEIIDSAVLFLSVSCIVIPCW
ncbi:MAG: hypothetical protein KTU85_12340 [Acidimicrobiia bacterium]|nr:hypothetical protein [Acidimicrobiia bacterium]